MKTFKEFIAEAKTNMILYHGTNKEFDKFDITKFGKTDMGYLGKGFYLTANKELAERYAKCTSDLHGGNPIVLMFMVTPKKTLKLSGIGGADFDDVLTELGIEHHSNANKITKELQALGYDSIIAKDKNNIEEFVAFSNSIIKRVK